MKKIFILPILALLFAGCSDDDDKHNNNELIPITLSSRLVVEPRASRQDVQIAANQQVSLFVTKTADINELVYDNAILTADGIGGFSYSYQGENVLYYPLDNERVNFYAIHPYSVNNNLSTNLGFQVRQNQALITDFLNSDLLYSRVTDIERSRNTVPMIFNHKLTKIKFIIVQGTGVDLAQLNAVNVLNIETEIEMNLTDGTLVPISNTPTTVNAYGVRGATGGDTRLEGISAIIVPQEFIASSDKRLFQFTLGNTDFYYTPAANITFESGKSYQYTITINDSGISITSSIEDWIPADDTEGEGTTE